MGVVDRVCFRWDEETDRNESQKMVANSRLITQALAKGHYDTTPLRIKNFRRDVYRRGYLQHRDGSLPFFACFG